MIPLFSPLPYSVEYQGKTYPLLPYFDRVLEAVDTVERADISPVDAISHALWLLVDKRIKSPDLGLLQAVFNILIEPAKEHSPKALDFTEDAALIYSAFMQTYGIDLREEHQLHWWKFIALLSGLPSDTRLMEIVRIRTMPVPDATKYNGEQIQEIMRLKSKYAVKLTEKEAEEQRRAGLQGLAKRLMSS